ncbi:MAG: hypothetical protein ACHQNE_03990 [Candidatus Kapaibacterium sp.]
MKGQHSHMNDPKHERLQELDTTDIRNPETRHEEGDINVRPVYKFLAWLGVLMVATWLITYVMMKANDTRIDRENAIVNHLQKSKTEELPPMPRLQLAPGEAMHPLREGMEYRDSVAQALESFGYINKAAGTVHIPIELAKQILLQRGLPVRAGATSADDGMIRIPSASSAGRVYIRRDQRIPGGTYTVTGGDMNVENMPQPH